MTAILRRRLLSPQLVPTIPVELNPDFEFAGGIVGAWLLNDGGARDYGPFGNNGLNPTGVTLANSESGPAQYYGGSGLITAPTSSTYYLPLPISLHARLKFTTTSNLVVFECNGNNGFTLQVGAIASGKVFFGVGGTSHGVVTSSLWNDGKLHDFLFIMPGVGVAGSVYVDGVLNTGSGTLLPSAPTYGTAPLYFGSRNGSVGYTGALSGLILWNYALPTNAAPVLAAKPYAAWRPVQRRRYYTAPSGGTTAYLALRGMSFSSGIFANTTASNLAMRALSATQGRAANDATAQTSTRGNSITSGVGSTAGLGYVAARGEAVSAGREATNALASVAARANSVASGREANTASAQIAARGLSSTSGRMSLFAASTFALVAGRGLAASFARMAVTATAGVAAVAGRGFAASFGRLSLWKAPPPKTPYVIPTTPTHFSIPSGKTIYNIPTTKSDESDPG